MTAESEPAEIGDDQLVRATYDDAISRDGRTLVLAGTHVLLLSEVSSAVIRHAANGISVGELGAVLQEEFGPPPRDLDVGFATRQFIAILEGQGLLARE